MLKIGITGGIGSGKTTACRIFETLGIPIYNADERAKELMSNRPDLIAGIKTIFGEKAYKTATILNRVYLANVLFKDKVKLEQLNLLVHPAVLEDSMQWQIEQAQKGALYSLKEAALLFESGTYVTLDKIIVVTAPSELRIQRVMARDGVDAEAVKARMVRQWPQADKVAKADFLIENINRNTLEAQVKAIHQQLLAT